MANGTDELWNGTENDTQRIWEQLRLEGEGTTEQVEMIDVAWALIVAWFVFLMQLGFMYLEVSGVRAEFVQSIVVKNLGDVCIGCVCWWAIGFGVAYGEDGSKNPVIGTANWFLSSTVDVPVPPLHTFILPMLYCTSAATIVSGAVAERIALSGYYCIAAVLSGLAYPLLVHWVWSPYGLLSPQNGSSVLGTGSLDFSGGGVIHAFGGSVAFFSAWWLGPRNLPDGRDPFDHRIKTHVVGHDLLSHACALFFLWFSWLPFNAGGALGFAEGGAASASRGMAVTLLVGSTAALTAILYLFGTTGQIPLGPTCNAALTGLAASSAVGAYVSLAYAPLIGSISAVVYFLFRKFRIYCRVDDVLDASAAHFGGGAWGMLCVGLFCDSNRVRLATSGHQATDGLFYGSYEQFVAQLVALAVIVAWSFVVTAATCYPLARTGKLRVSNMEEQEGCDLRLFGTLAFEFDEKMSEEIKALKMELESRMRFPASVVRLSLQELEVLEREAANYRDAVRHRLEADNFRRRVPSGKESRLSLSPTGMTPAGFTPPGISPGGVSASGPSLLRAQYEEHHMPTDLSPFPIPDLVIGQPSPSSPGPILFKALPDPSQSSTPSPGVISPSSATIPAYTQGGGGSVPGDTLFSTDSKTGRFKQFTAALQPLTKQQTEHAEDFADMEDGDYWEPPLNQLPRAPLPPPEDIPPSPPESEDEAVWEERGLSPSRFPHVDAEASEDEQEEKEHRSRSAPSKRVRNQLWGAAVLLLGAATGVAAADSGFEDVGIKASTLDLGQCETWIQQAAAELGSLKSKRLQFEVDLDSLWILVCGILVFLMQLGFCFLETGAVRASNVQNTVLKNLGDLCIGAVVWWSFGNAFAYGGGENRFIGLTDFFLTGRGQSSTYLPSFVLRYTYATTTCTIISGAVAERATLWGYYALSVVMIGFTYPLAAHWVWNKDGWMNRGSPDNFGGANGLLDFAGSGVIHCCGASAGFMAAIMLGKRNLPNGVDVFSEEGQRLTAPHNKFNSAVGTLLLWFSWFGFNAGSVPSFAENPDVAANAVVSTMLSGSSACLMALFAFPVLLHGHYELTHICNSVLTGLVASTAGCAYVSPASSIAIGSISAFVYLGFYRLRMWAHVDDVVDIGAVHLAGGAWGMVAVGLFADASRIRAGTGDPELGGSYGMLMGGGLEQLGTQVVGTLVIIVWSASVTAATLSLLKFTPFGIRVPQDAELHGTDKYYCGGLTYDHLAQLEKQIDLAENAAEAISAMRFHELEYLWKTKTPSRLDGAFKKIVENLREYAAYLPESILDQPDRVSEVADLPHAALDLRKQADATSVTSPFVSEPATGSYTTSLGRKRLRARTTQTYVGLQLHRSCVVIYAELAARRGGLADALSKEMGPKSAVQDATCAQCSLPVFSVTMCPVTNKRHSPPVGSVTAILSEWLEAAVRCQTELGGMFETLIGAGAVVSFQAGKIISQPATSACLAAVQLRKAGESLKSKHADLTLSPAVGVSSGSVCVGNIGGEDMRRRVLVGDALGDAITLSRLVRDYKVTAFIDNKVGKDAIKQGFHGLREIAAFRHAGSKVNRMVFHLDASAPDPIAAEAKTFAGAWGALQRGAIPEGVSRLSAYIRRNPTDSVATEVLRRVLAFRDGMEDVESPIPYANELRQVVETPFYAEAGAAALATPAAEHPLSSEIVSVLCCQLLPREPRAHAAALQAFASTVRAHQGSLAWGGDERLTAWWTPESCESESVLLCLSDLLRSPIFNPVSSEDRQAGLGLCCDRVHFGIGGGETDKVQVVLGGASTRAQVLAWVALGERLPCLVDGILPSSACGKGFAWEAVARGALYNLPGGSSLMGAGKYICTLRDLRADGAADHRAYKRAWGCVEAAEWGEAIDELQAKKVATDPWASKLLESCRNAELSRSASLIFALSHSGIDVRLSTRRGTVGEEDVAKAGVAVILDRDHRWDSTEPIIDPLEFFTDVARTQRLLFGEDMQSEGFEQVRDDNDQDSDEVSTPEGSDVALFRIRALQWMHIPMGLVIMWNALAVPSRCAFLPDGDINWDGTATGVTIVDYLSDVIFISVFVLRFLVPYVEDGMYVVDPPRVARHYYESPWCSVDLVSAFPWELLYVAAAGGETLIVYPWLRANRLLQLLRLPAVIKVMYELDAGLSWAIPVRLTVLMAVFMLFSCWMGCLWGAVVRSERGFDVFLSEPGFSREGVAHQAARGFFVAASGCWLGTLPFGETDGEVIVFLVMAVTGLYLVGVTLAWFENLRGFALSARVARDERRELIADLGHDRNWAKLHGFRREVKDFHQQMWTQCHLTRPREYNFMFEELPRHLATELRFWLAVPALDVVESLRPVCPGAHIFAASVLTQCEHSFYPPGEVLIERGSGEEGVYFFLTGSAAALGVSYREVLGPGDHWGEVVAIWGGIQRAELVVTAHAQVLWLGTAKFKKLASAHPPCFKALVEAGRKRKELFQNDEEDDDASVHKRVACEGKEMSAKIPIPTHGRRMLPAATAGWVGHFPPTPAPNPLARAGRETGVTAHGVGGPAFHPIL
eukprot:Hpha_TRINITY_DN10418_c0_g1::TRINITY_DN10418_c0_g1_i1::g.193288::m.193288